MESNNVQQTLTFEKEHTGRWYVVLPEWTGGKAALEMVEGADTMLDIMAQGEKEVTLTVSEQPFEDANKLILTEDLSNSIGGGMYLLKDYQGGEINHKMWLCEVITYVFKKLPPVVYFK
ncbi:DUF6717 family protein [Mucilaginibacter lacusdianchii]|uniref:DUF6717 family protein n=1 Tax=Mucilaginibacter lacusdianchii TaxID=2684211 RepID=UPI00131D30EC|nr:DUF6717 family protein [Mucilaginibacter sp. JXJ CY 39]